MTKTCQSHLNDLLKENAHLRVNGALASDRTREAAYDVLPSQFVRLYKLDTS